MMKPDPTKSASSSPGDSALNVGMQQVIVEVLHFLKHPAGHTVYECRVEIPPTRQVRSIVYKSLNFATRPRTRIGNLTLSFRDQAGRAFRAKRVTFT